MADRLLTQLEAATALGITVETLRHWRYAGTIRFVTRRGRDIRIPASEVERLNQYCQAPLACEPTLEGMAC